jgi:hypothetical protein
MPAVPAPRFDIAPADGTEAVRLDPSEAFVRLDSFSDGTVVVGWRGSGTDDRFDGDHRVSPNPLSALTVRFSWPHFDLSTTETPIEEQSLRAAIASALTSGLGTAADIR